MKEQLGRLAKSALIYGTGEVLTKIIAFLLLPLFTAFLLPDDYGVNAILASVTFVLNAIFSLGFGNVIGILYFDKNAPEHQRPATVWTAALMLTISAVLMYLVLGSRAADLSQLLFRTPAYAPLVLLTLAANVFSLVAMPFSFSYQFEGRAAQYTTLSLTSAFLYIMTSVGAVSILRAGIYGWVAATLIGNGITLLLFAIPVMRRIPFRLRPQIAVSLLRLGLPLVPSFAFLFVLQQSNRFFLERLSGLDEVGIYAIGSSLGMTINLAIQGFTRAWYPYFLSFTEKQDEAKPLFARITSYYVIGGGCLTLCYFLFARPLVLIMTAPAFHTAYTIVGWIAAAQFLTGLFNVLLPGMYFAQDVRVQTPIQAGAALITVIACLLAIPPFGALGGALALVIGTVAMCLLTHLWNSAHQTYFRVAYELGRIGKFAAFFAVIALLSIIPRDLSIPVEIALGIAGMLVMAGFAYSLIDADEKAQLFRLARRFLPKRFASTP